MHRRTQQQQCQFALLVLYKGSARQEFRFSAVQVGGIPTRQTVVKLRRTRDIRMVCSRVHRSIRRANARGYRRMPFEYPPKRTANTPRIPTRAGQQFAFLRGIPGAIGSFGSLPSGMHGHGGGAVSGACVRKGMKEEILMDACGAPAVAALGCRGSLMDGRCVGMSMPARGYVDPSALRSVRPSIGA